MKNKKYKSAFTLVEVMVVLLVLTILFAAFAPLITKRQRFSRKTNLWVWSSRNYMAGPMDAVYMPQQDGYMGGIYFGTIPDSENDIKSSYTPLSKVNIRSGYISDNLIQRHLQLRYGRADFDDPGQLAATFIADNSNMLFGGIFPDLNHHYSNETYPSGNVGFGVNSLNQVKDNNNENQISKNNTAFGYNALSLVSNGTGNTVVGASAAQNSPAVSKSTFVGYMAGYNNFADANTLIGYKSMSISGGYNTLVGANTGYFDENNQNISNNSLTYKYNVALGYGALNQINNGEHNVAIGAGALKNLKTGYNNVAIGYNACANLTHESNKTCIGYNSGPASNTPVRGALGIALNDNTPVTYIGSNPNMKNDGTWESSDRYGGDAVLEIYNSKNPTGSNNKNLINNPHVQSNATTIINGNLIVRGRTFFTIGNVLYPFYYDAIDSYQVFGTASSEACAGNQVTYAFSNSSDRCSVLAPITSTSDRRLKIISSKNNDGLDKINQLKIYNYTFKADKQKNPHVGVIAQDLQKVFPNSVFKDSKGILNIRWDEMFYAAINSIKQLSIKVASLVKANLSIENKIKRLEKKNAILHKQVDELSNRVQALKSK